MQGDIYQKNQGRNFDERANNGGKGNAGFDTKDGDGDGDGQLKIISRRGESERGGTGIIGSETFRHKKADEEHDREINHQWEGDAQHVEREFHDSVALGNCEYFTFARGAYIMRIRPMAMGRFVVPTVMGAKNASGLETTKVPKATPTVMAAKIQAVK